jgi:hypothetical protein
MRLGLPGVGIGLLPSKYACRSSPSITSLTIRIFES